jgi:hypothetical protein
VLDALVVQQVDALQEDGELGQDVVADGRIQRAEVLVEFRERAAARRCDQPFLTPVVRRAGAKALVLELE